MKNLVTLALLFAIVAVPVFAQDSGAPAIAEQSVCENAACTCNPCECDFCECTDVKKETSDCCEQVTCCSQENCTHGDADDHKNNK